MAVMSVRDRAFVLMVRILQQTPSGGLIPMGKVSRRAQARVQATMAVLYRGQRRGLESPSTLSWERALTHFQLGKLVTAHRVHKLLGLMAAASVVIPLGLLSAVPHGDDSTPFISIQKRKGG